MGHEMPAQLSAPHAANTCPPTPHRASLGPSLAALLTALADLTSRRWQRGLASGLRALFAHGLLALAAMFGLPGVADAQSYQSICYAGADWSRYSEVRVEFHPEDCWSWYRSVVKVNGLQIGRVGNGDFFGSAHCESTPVVLYNPTYISLTADYQAGSGGSPFSYSFSNDCSPNYEDSHTSPREGYVTFTAIEKLPPALTVSKATNTPYWADGGTGQYYYLTISVSNSATTAPIYITDSLPAGVTVSSTIYGSGASVYGCPGVGATNLTGCYIPAGVLGTVYVYIPVTVATGAASHNSYTVANTAYVSGGGSSNCTSSACPATTSNTVINAIDDTDAKPPGVVSSTDVSVNDAYPGGATFRATGGTCTSPGPVTAGTSGVLSYTVPTGSASCTVTYQLCAPVYTTVCDTATLTVTAAPPRITVTKQLGGNRAANTDQFTVQVLQGASVLSSPGNTTTTGSNATVDANTGTTGPTNLAAGTSYTVNEVAAGTTNLARYSQTLSCSNGASGNYPTGLGTPFTAQSGDNILCTLRNKLASPVLTVQKALGGAGRVAAGDQFTVQILSGATVVNSATNSTTSGSGSSVDANTGTTLPTTLTAGTSYTIQELASGTTKLTQYAGTLSCTDSTGGSRALTLNTAFTLQDGDLVNCTLTNTQAPAKLTIQKQTIAGTGTFVFRGTANANGFSTNGSYSITTTAANTPIAGGQVTLTALATTTAVQETAPANWLLTSAICSDNNSAATGNPAFFGTLNTTTKTLTIPAARVLPGADLQCLFTNAPLPRLTIKKVSTGGTGSFSFNGTANANGFSTSNDYVVGTATAGVAASGSSVYLAAANTATEVQETVPSSWTLQSATCTDTNAAITGNPAAFGTLTGNTLRIDDTYVLPGADMQCTFTNTPLPTITLDQTVTGGLTMPVSYSYTGNNGWTQKNVTSTLAGVPGTATPVQSLTAAGVDTILTPTLPIGLKIGLAYCSDNNYANNGNTGGTFGTYTDTTFTIPAGNIRSGSVLVCHVTIVFTPAKLTVQKTTTVGTGTLTFNGNAPNANGFSTNSSYSITTGAAGTPTKGSTVTLAANNTRTDIRETPASNWVLMGASCVDANASLTNNTGTFGTLNGYTLEIPAANVGGGSDLLCSFTNAPQPTITLDQTVTDGLAMPVAYNYTGNNGWTAKNVSSSVGGVAGTPTPVQSLASAGVDTILTPALPAGLRIGLAYCGDSNYASNGNTGGTFGSYTDSTITIPANNIRGGSALVCHVTLLFTQPKLTIRKLTTVGTGSFTFNGSAPNTNGFGTNYSVSTTTAGVAASGSPVTLGADSVTTMVSETVAGNWLLSSATCVDNNASLTSNTGTFGTLTGNTLQIDPGNVKPGSDLQCTFTNAPKPATLSLTQAISGSSGVPPPVTFDYTGTNGWGSRPVSSSAEGSGTPGPAISLSSNGVETVLTVTLLPGWQLGSVNCGDANGGNTTNGGSNFGFKDGNSLRIPAANVVAGAVINCSMDLGLAPPTIVVNKLLSSARLNSNDQFTVQIKSGGTPLASGTTTGSAATVDGGTGSTGLFPATAGTAYSITEVMGTGSSSALAAYSPTVVCQNKGMGGAVASGVHALDDSFTAQAGNVVVCTITNGPRAATLTVRQVVLSPVPPNLAQPYRLDYAGGNGWTSQQISNPVLDQWVDSSTNPLTANNIDTPISTTLPDARWFVIAFRCSDTAAAVSGNPSGFLANSTGTSVTVLAANVRAGAALVCSMVLGHVTP